MNDPHAPIQAIQWSFDLEEARYQLLAERDDLSTIIRGHLYVEHVLMEFIRVALQKPTALSIDRLAFRTKVELCVALGTVPENLVPPIKILNRLRNSAAHELGHVTAATTKKELLDSLPKIGSELVFSDEFLSENTPLEGIPLGRILLVILVLLDFERHRYQEWLARKLDAETNLREAVENLRREQEKRPSSQQKKEPL